MAMESTTNPASVADRIRTFFSKKLLEHTKNTLVMDQWANKEGIITANWGAKSIRWFKRRPAKTDDVVTLVEGVPITTFTEVDMGYVDATLVQYGEAAKITDIRKAIDLFPPLQQGIEAMGEDSALHADTITRNAIVLGMLNSNNAFERFAGVKGTGNSGNDFATLNGLASNVCQFNRLRGLATATWLATKKVPKINGGYISVICPEIMHDGRLDDDWRKAAQFNGEKLYKRQALELDGITYIEQTNPFREDVYGTPADAGAVFTAIYLGRGAYGTPKLANMADEDKPQIVICDKPDKSDMLNQFCTAGWKAFWTAKLLKTSQASDIPFAALLRCKSTFNELA